MGTMRTENKEGINRSLASIELEKQSSEESYNEWPYQNGSKPHRREEVLENVIALAKGWDRVAAGGDITEQDKIKEEEFKDIIERVGCWTGVILNDVYLPVYPMAKQLMRQMEHIVFNKNGQFSSNGHTENGSVDTSK